MAFKALTPMLNTRDIVATLRFYTEVLGFSCENKMESEEGGWVSLKKDGVSIMFSTLNAHLPFERESLTGSLYIECDNVDELWESLKPRAKVCYGIENFDYGMREFAIFDNNDYLIQFGQTVESLR